MKSIKKIKLNHLCDNMLDEKQQIALKGGSDRCSCSVRCGCPSWDGSGCMPPGQNSSDAGRGSVSANLSDTANGGFN